MNEEELVKAWQGDNPHIDFKDWLIEGINTAIEAQAALERIIARLQRENAAQAQQLDQARKAMYDIDDDESTIASCLEELRYIVPQDEEIWRYWLERQDAVIRAWLTAQKLAETRKRHDDNTCKGA